MSELKEIIEKEKKRDMVQQMRQLYFYKEGTFMRAYEYSAWLWCKYVKEFKPTRRKAKQVDEPIIHIGCPATSLGNHLPEGANASTSDDGAEIVITLPDALIPDTTDLEPIFSEFSEWKQSFPITETAKKKNDAELLDNSSSVSPSSISGIMQQILAFPLEKKTMLECVAFLSDLKTQLAKHF